MSRKIDLFNRPWKLQSWRPHTWFLQNSAETDAPFYPEHDPCDAVLPGGGNTSIINYDGTPKPAFHAIKEVFRRNPTL